MHRRRRGSRGRFPIQPDIKSEPKAKRMEPSPVSDTTPIHLNMAEAEVLRLVDLEGFYQDQAGHSMGLSRGTIWRLLSSAREKVVRSLYEGRPLIVGLAPAEDQE